jgi:hypothetical protein
MLKFGQIKCEKDPFDHFMLFTTVDISGKVVIENHSDCSLP